MHKSPCITCPSILTLIDQIDVAATVVTDWETISSFEESVALDAAIKIRKLVKNIQDHQAMSLAFS